MPAHENFDDRCRKLYEPLGWVFEVVERRVRRQAKKDFCGFADYLAFHPEEQATIAVQSTVKEEFTRHLNKILDEPRALAWNRAGNGIELVIWTRQFTPGPNASINWTPEIFTIGPAQFAARRAIKEMERRGA